MLLIPTSRLEARTSPVFCGISSTFKDGTLFLGKHNTREGRLIEKITRPLTAEVTAEGLLF